MYKTVCVCVCVYASEWRRITESWLWSGGFLCVSVCEYFCAFRWKLSMFVLAPQLLRSVSSHFGTILLFGQSDHIDKNVFSNQLDPIVWYEQLRIYNYLQQYK